MPILSLYSDYSRQDVHDIFSPNTRFTQGSGTWGLLGIVEIADHPDDFVLFVTFGQHQADHAFDEWITEEGIFSWQSQPSQSLHERRIQQFIHHDERRNNIYIFLRTKQGVNYTYLGRLKFLAHDISREKPVYMYWQLVEWPVPEDVLSRINLHLQPANFYRGDKAKILKPFYGNDHYDTTFVWRGKEWQVNRESFVSQIKDWIARDLPDEAIRYKHWYIDIDGHRISPKWLFHLITGAGYNEFDAPQAREKLAKVGFFSFQVEEPDEVQYTHRTNGHGMDGDLPKKPYQRRILFEKINKWMTGEHPDLFLDANFRFPEGRNWCEIHFPKYKGYYSLRFAREFLEVAYFFSGSRLRREASVRILDTDLDWLSEKIGYSITANPCYEKAWGRFGFEIPKSDVFSIVDFPWFLSPAEDFLAHNTFARIYMLVTNDSEKYKDLYQIDRFGSACAYLFAHFIQLTFPLVSKTNVQSPSFHKPLLEDGSFKEFSSQCQRMLEIIAQIRRLLMGASELPSADVLCDWVHFCYEFGLYTEGHRLFSFVPQGDVHPWYFERTKKFARLCSLRAAEKV